ncbi:MAG: hypothetical protein KKC05_04235 [Nanoarchaeota archaeon]|nr:hypothetical protein [Nanoarchaeota archaeon]
MDYEEYEVVPTSPIRNLERRVSRVETSSSSSEVRRLIEQIIELIKSNQRIIDDVIKADSELRDELSRIPGKIDDLLMSMHEFMELLKTSATEETVSDISKDVMAPVVKKMDELVENTKKNTEVNQAALTSLSIIDKRLKRIYMQTGASADAYRR